ncbi:hypothetical protein UFOVP380_52 [uncultured Caudovirales phage]|uniref:Uncharacterized protein n=1 Tax=uncultured Caudovirales phage TaxID=2100421 RepID=A0A6J7X351_9CAUD|nr:hypothetical protein UFOVP380_52 [uncultured Caudovirales phage]
MLFFKRPQGGAVQREYIAPPKGRLQIMIDVDEYGTTEATVHASGPVKAAQAKILHDVLGAYSTRTEADRTRTAAEAFAPQPRVPLAKEVGQC